MWYSVICVLFVYMYCLDCTQANGELHNGGLTKRDSVNAKGIADAEKKLKQVSSYLDGRPSPTTPNRTDIGQMKLMDKYNAIVADLVKHSKRCDRIDVNSIINQTILTVGPLIALVNKLIDQELISKWISENFTKHDDSSLFTYFKRSTCVVKSIECYSEQITNLTELLISTVDDILQLVISCHDYQDSQLEALADHRIVIAEWAFNEMNEALEGEKKNRSLLRSAKRHYRRHRKFVKKYFFWADRHNSYQDLKNDICLYSFIFMIFTCPGATIAADYYLAKSGPKMKEYGAKLNAERIAQDADNAEQEDLVKTIEHTRTVLIDMMDILEPVFSGPRTIYKGRMNELNVLNLRLKSNQNMFIGLAKHLQANEFFEHIDDLLKNWVELLVRINENQSEISPVIGNLMLKTGFANKIIQVVDKMQARYSSTGRYIMNSTYVDDEMAWQEIPDEAVSQVNGMGPAPTCDHVDKSIYDTCQLGLTVLEEKLEKKVYDSIEIEANVGGNNGIPQPDVQMLDASVPFDATRNRLIKLKNDFINATQTMNRTVENELARVARRTELVMGEADTINSMDI